ncbi:acylneuraminate cytidylyltransferase [Paenibacillus psychroresistens]|uniref:Acylneuraminate cytidylyltransferase n=1 Tax=Paenibacillus psychroresistens TaxID=1778678 RepID=A0A6B8RG09_9BACL|nr:glycosyltransferase family protein [Paenibacillus psychroresistens]QGQ94358.1 acylneuraminate cytidylyltransferase [Paenibacillus psychroresistens]
MKVVAIIQARMNSTRLPGKILYKVLNQTLLEYQIERIRRVPLIDEIIVATTTNPGDQPIVDLCRKLGISTYRGSELDVLSRYYEAATLLNADVIVRLTSDCPVIDPFTIDRVISHYLFHASNLDYVSNFLKRSYPRGMDTEVFSIEALRIAQHEATLIHDREHVTPYIYTNSDRFRLEPIQYMTNESHHRWTVDTQEDFQLISKIIESLYPTKLNFTLEDMLALLQEYPQWSQINAYVQQKIV